MNRRRLYVFGTIILVGLLVGLFVMPGSSDKDTRKNAAPPPAKVKPQIPKLPAADIGNQASERARTLYEQAAQMKNLKDRIDCLREACRIDRTGRWGGAAAAQMGDLCKKLGETDKARQWYLLAARAKLSAAMLRHVNTQLDAMKRAAEIPAASKIEMIQYRVRPNDSWWKIARLHATTIGALKKANHTTSDVIRPGQTVHVPKGPFHVVVSKSTHTLQLLQGDRVVKVYPVGLGKSGCTPTGEWLVSSKLKKPTWNSDQGPIPYGDPRNILGSRWIGFNGRIGIHGTPKEQEHTIGTDSSQGCIRMRDVDVRELYNFLVRGKSKVKIID